MTTKKIAFFSTIILIGVAALYLYRNSGYYVTQKVYSVINHPKELKKICNNEHTYSYLLKHKGKRIQLSDNQGSRNIFYYPGYYGNQEISLTGEFTPFDLKINRIALHK